MQIIILVSHNVLTATASPIGYQVLKLIRRYQVIDMYLGFETHTEETMDSLRAALKDWSVELEVRCISPTTPTNH